MRYLFYGYLGRDIPLPAVMSLTNGSLAISKVEENNEGWYVCEAENIGGKTRLQVFLKVSLSGRGNSNICFIKQYCNKNNDTVYLLFTRSKGHGSGCTTALSRIQRYLCRVYCVTPPTGYTLVKVLASL